jgi:3-isopropylmalate/(R)-2-methylmalate dehydratase small subunit
MQPFTTLDGLVMPLDRVNVDTDQIIPQRFLRKISRTGFGPDLFANLRYVGDTQTANPDFVLNFPRYQGAQILLARANFGCGSSREHAPWALLEYGFRCLIAPSFADIFYNNCFQNGILPIILPEETIDTLFGEVEVTPGYTLHVSLPDQVVVTPAGRRHAFAIDSFKKYCLVNGLDSIGLTLQHEDEIAAFEARHTVFVPAIV